jgi:hypothetical protein
MARPITLLSIVSIACPLMAACMTDPDPTVTRTTVHIHADGTRDLLRERVTAEQQDVEREEMLQVADDRAHGRPISIARPLALPGADHNRPCDYRDFKVFEGARYTGNYTCYVADPGAGVAHAYLVGLEDHWGYDIVCEEVSVVDHIRDRAIIACAPAQSFWTGFYQGVWQSVGSNCNEWFDPTTPIAETSACVRAADQIWYWWNPPS